MNSPLFYLAMYALYALLYAIGFLLALINWRRCPKACGLMLVATSVNFIVTLARGSLHYALMAIAIDIEVYSIAMAALTFVQWLGLGLIILAVFVGRGDPASLPYRPRRRFPLDDDWDDSEPPPTRDAAGIQEREP